MRLKVQHVMDATLIISAIIRDRRAMPQKGKYRLARMHAKLLPEFTTINAQRDDMIKEYNTHQTIATEDPETKEVTVTPTEEWIVPADKMPEFTDAWKAIADQEIDLDVEPIPLSQLDMGDGSDGAIEAHELITLGDLVSDK